MKFQLIAGISARHLHLCQKDMDVLFGSGSELHPKSFIKQPGQYASEEQVVLKTDKSEMKLRVIGPLRSATQIELSCTDARSLGINPPIRNSGHIEGSLGGLLIGPLGQVVLQQGIIIAARHIHLYPESAAKYNLKDGDIVDIKTSGIREVIMHNVLVRSGEKHADECHIDTDEANASGVVANMMVEIITK